MNDALNEVRAQEARRIIEHLINHSLAGCKDSITYKIPITNSKTAACSQTDSRHKSIEKHGF
jgi:hypothetical protein